MKNIFALLLLFPLATICAEKQIICRVTKNSVPLALQEIAVQPTNQPRLTNGTLLLAPPPLRHPITADAQVRNPDEQVKDVLFTGLANAACCLFWGLL